MMIQILAKLFTYFTITQGKSADKIIIVIIYDRIINIKLYNNNSQYIFEMIICWSVKI